MSSHGWVSVHRQIRDHAIWQDRPFSRGQAWIDLLLRASYEQKKVIIGNQVVEIQPGEFITSDKKLMEAWGWGKEKTRSFLKLLESDTMITRKPDRRWTVISIVNWDRYQVCQTDNRPTADRWQTAGRPLADSINNNNNITSKQIDDGGCYQPTTGEYDEIVRMWNEIPHTISIQNIAFGTHREDELRIVISMYGMDGLKEAIQRVKDSVYLQRIGHVKFDSYINRNVVQKLLEGSYDDDYQTQAGGTDYGLARDW